MEQYFLTLQTFTLEEYEVWKQLNKYCNFETGIAGYTVNQLVVNSDKRLELTTQKVRTILRKFKESGYIEILSSGSKGKESTLKITIKQQLFNNYSTNKSEQFQGVEGNEQQQSNNNLTTLSKKKENNNIYSEVVDYLNSKANTNYRTSTKNTQSLISARLKEGFTVEDFKKVIDNKSNSWIGTEWERYLRPATLFGTKFENYLNENKKAPIAVGTQKNNSVNPNICNPRRKYTQACDVG